MYILQLSSIRADRHPRQCGEGQSIGDAKFEQGIRKRGWKLADKPGSVVDNHSSRPAITHRLKQPTRSRCGSHQGNLFGLAPGGVYLAIFVTKNAVRSYRTLSPLPVYWRSTLCCTSRQSKLPRRYLAPYPMEPGLSSPSN